MTSSKSSKRETTYSKSSKRETTYSKSSKSETSDGVVKRESVISIKIYMYTYYY